MKANFFFKQILVIVLLLSICTIGMAQDFTVNEYNVKIEINKEGYFDVTEKYDVVFDIEKHGLWRKIPIKYNFQDEDGTVSERSIRISKIKVPGWKYDTEGGWWPGDRNLGIKIGDPDKYVTGAQVYIIQYRVNRAFIYEKNNDVFYWNLMGREWEAEFKKVNFSVTLPKNIPLAKDRYFVYTGEVGDTTANASYQYENGVLTGSSKEALGNGKDMTIMIKLPKGVIVEKTANQLLWEDYQWTSFFLLLLLIFYFLWKKFGKDRNMPEVVEYFPPTGVDPVMAGYLIDDKADSRDLTSLIPHWGANGYLSLTEIGKKGLFSKKDIVLKKLKDIPSNVHLYERTFFNGLFSSGDEIKVSDLKDSFYTTMNDAKMHLSSAARTDGYYDKKSHLMRFIMAGGLILLGGLGGVLLLWLYGVLAFIAWLIVCIILAIWSLRIMKRPTEKGDLAKQQTNGFKMFIEKAEKDKLEFLLWDDPSYFEKTLAYAVAFGMAKKWARKFDGLNLQPPGWYHGASWSGSTVGAFNAASFTDSFTGSMSSMSSTMVSSPSSSSSSSGGGSSGGGFGGGGGGSW